jgi:hypothetical protein
MRFAAGGPAPPDVRGRLQTFFIAREKLIGMTHYLLRAAAGALVATIATGCNGGGAAAPHLGNASGPILTNLHTQTTIGSTVDPGPGTVGTTPANQQIYFNDDNANTVVLISQ